MNNSNVIAFERKENVIEKIKNLLSTKEGIKEIFDNSSMFQFERSNLGTKVSFEFEENIISYFPESEKENLLIITKQREVFERNESVLLHTYLKKMVQLFSITQICVFVDFEEEEEDKE